MLEVMVNLQNDIIFLFLQPLKFVLGMTWGFGTFFAVCMCFEAPYESGWDDLGSFGKTCRVLKWFLGTYLGLFIVIYLLLAIVGGFLYPFKLLGGFEYGI